MAAMVADVWAVTALEVTVNVAVVAPAATVTVLGTLADGSLLLRVTTAPPEGADALRVTVPVELAWPPTTVVGLRVTEVTISGGVTVRVAVWVTPLRVARMVTVWVEVTG